MAFEDQKQSKTSKPFLVCVPTEIIVEILFRLPVVSLLRYKCVCKLWFSLISDPYFINCHVKNLLTTTSTNNEYAHRHHRLILTTETQMNIKTCHLCDVLHDKAVNTLEIDYPFKHHVKSVSVVGSCNGLLCIRFGDTFCIWNPSTRRSSKRFSPCFDFNVWSKWHLVYGFGFGYDESTDEYKVVELCRLLNNGTEFHTLTAHIDSLKSGNWKNFSQFPQGFLVKGNGTSSNGALHWLAGKSQTDGHYLRSVVSFALATETYGKFSQPPYDKGCSVLKLGALGEWLCVLCNYLRNHGDLWVMKVYGVTNSWIKLFSIPYPTDFKRTWDVVFVPLCVLDDGKILLQLGSKLVLYDLKNSSFSEIRSVDKWRNAITFVESLVPPDSLAVILWKQCSLYATLHTD